MTKPQVIGCMVCVWSECTENGSEHLDKNLVDACFPRSGDWEYLVQSGLADKTNSKTTIRIRGTNGRIEWLEKKRLSAIRNGKLGGRPKSKTDNQQPNLTEPTSVSVGSGSDSARNLSMAMAMGNTNRDTLSSGDLSSSPTQEVSPAEKSPDVEPKPIEPEKPKPASKKKTKMEPKYKTPRPRDALFDAIVKITGADPSVSSQAARIGKVKKELLEADPPYTAEDVLNLPAIAKVKVDWLKNRTITINEIPNHIHLARKVVSVKASEVDWIDDATGLLCGTRWPIEGYEERHTNCIDGLFYYDIHECGQQECDCHLRHAERRAKQNGSN